VLTEILRGGQDKVHEAGAVVVGGHTVTDEEIKYGLAVTGRADPRRLLTNAAAAPGDVIVLTKPIGTGILATAVKRGDVDAVGARQMLDSMALLNRDASRAALAVGARCATDVTGFGLLGHLSHISRASGVTLLVRPGDVPMLVGAAEAWRRGARTGGASRNVDYLETVVDWGHATEVQKALLTDPQTSGGLLVAVPAARAGDYLSAVPGAVVIGEVLPRASAGIVLG
jgi:selenide,water dikinase